MPSGALPTAIGLPPVVASDFGLPTGAENVAKIGVPSYGTEAAPDYFGTLGATGAITVPAVSKNFYITKVGVAALTLVAPVVGVEDGVSLSFISVTASAHTITLGVAGWNGGATTIATFGGAKGDNMQITAYQGVWYVRNKTNVTLS